MSGDSEPTQAIEPTTVAPVKPATAPPAKAPVDPTPTMSQAQFKAALDRRTEKIEAKYADYDSLKTAANKLADIETAQLSELDQAQKAMVEAQAQAAQALKMSKARLIRAGFIASAAKAGAAHPEDAFSLADQSAVTLDDAGNVTGVEEAVAVLVEEGRLVMSAKPAPPNLDGGNGGGKRPTERVKLTVDEERLAKEWGMTPEEYQKSKDRGKE